MCRRGVAHGRDGGYLAALAMAARAASIQFEAWVWLYECNRRERFLYARYRCLTCGHTFRVYPHGVTQAHTSLRVRDLAALLYQLGLSYGAISTALEAWKVYLCKSQVYRAIRAQKRDLALPRSQIFGGVRAQSNARPPLLIHVRDSWAPAVLMADHANRLVLTLHLPSLEAAEQCRAAVMTSAAVKDVEIRLTGNAEERKRLAIDSSACQDADTYYHQTSNAHAR